MIGGNSKASGQYDCVWLIYDWWKFSSCFSTCEGVREDPHTGDPAASAVHGEGDHDGADHGDGGGPGGHGHARLQRTEAQPGQILLH